MGLSLEDISTRLDPIIDFLNDFKVRDRSARIEASDDLVLLQDEINQSLMTLKLRQNSEIKVASETPTVMEKQVSK